MGETVDHPPGWEAGDAPKGWEPIKKAPDPFYGGRGEFGELITPEYANRQAQMGVGLASAVVPFAAPARVAGAAFGGYEGYRHAGVPGAIGGAIAGAVKPGLTTTGLGAAMGYEKGGLPGMVIATILGTSLAKLPGVSSALRARLAHVLEQEAPEAAAAVRNASAAVPAVAASAPTAAAPAMTPAVASAAPAVAEAALPTTLSQKQLELVGQLRGLAQNNPANKIKIAQAAQEMFPNSWQEVLKFIMAPRTTMPTIHMP